MQATQIKANTIFFFSLNLYAGDYSANVYVCMCDSMIYEIVVAACERVSYDVRIMNIR